MDNKTIQDHLRNAIVHSSSMPLYAQVRDSIKALIEQGVFSAGDSLPGELELCNLLEVSRPVIRQALRELGYEGLVIRKQGRGTFVSKPRVTRGLTGRFAGLHEDMSASGTTLKSRVLHMEVVTNSRAAHFLNLTASDPVIEIERLRYTDEEPLVLVSSFLPHHLCSLILKEDLTQQSLYALLDSKCGLKIARAQRTVEAVLANKEEAELLDVEEGAALALVESIGYTSDGTAIEYFNSFYRGDRMRFVVELRHASYVENGEATGAIKEMTSFQKNSERTHVRL